mmetsp:Transcript_9108/g.15585  ORF Transcript_9108/g.15585 Transcript_9108/m.15585 type:complete len:115 (-) Transcript_9108:918-1262(-)
MAVDYTHVIELEARKYLHEKRIPILIEKITTEIVLRRPDDPRQFILDLLQGKIRPYEPNYKDDELDKETDREDADEYMQRHGIPALFQTFLTETISRKPADPKQALIELLGLLS